MKSKLFSCISCFLIVVSIAFMLTGCTTKLNGTYKSDGIISQSFTFSDDNKVTMSAFGIDANGTYVIEDGKITITYSLLGLSYDWKKNFKKDGNSIYIDGTEFTKQ